ncbi:MAG: dihydrolipoyl dehydrogenase [Deltaproteobacteria bacterium]|nr:dihydrolipoyl dehydrogenase [Deltaproteobacteria bacterium]
MYDVLVIGGGPGGYAAGIRAAQLGGKTALVEDAELGGTCVNRGCIPSKVWHRAAYLLYWIRRADEFGIQAPVEALDLGAIVERKNGVAAEIRTGMEALLGNNGIEFIRGRGRLKGPGEVAVDGKVLNAKTIILATGSSLHIPDIPGLKEAAVTTDQVLNLTRVPESALICGNGPIEIEAATVLNQFGSKVYLSMDSARPLPREDGETGQRIGQALREQGVELLPKTELASVKQASSGCEALLSGASEKTLKVEAVVASSRKPATGDLGLENLGVACDETGAVKVNERLETSVKEVYAIGDATGGWMLSHASSAMGVCAAENAMGRQVRFSNRLVPRGVWSIPQVGAVGLSEEEAEEQGYDVQVGDFPNAINGLAMSRNQVEGAVKIVSDATYGDILGVHIVGANATELIGEAVMALQLECTTDELAHTIRVHPTFSEAVMDAGRDAENWALYLPTK